MRVIPFLSIIASMPSFFLMVHERLYGDVSEGGGSKCQNDSVLSRLVKAEASFDNLIKNLSLLIGTSVLGMIADPPDAEKKADLLFNEFKESYNLFIYDFKKLLDCIVSQKESLKGCFGSDWMRVETLRSAFGSPEIDWNYILEKKTLICDNSILKNERKFNTCLFDKLRGLIFTEASEAGVLSYSLIPPEFVSVLFRSTQAVNPAVNHLVNILSAVHGEDRDEEVQYKKSAGKSSDE
ncbi:MAG: hypothetical protein PHI15_07090 [Methanomicrobium sp.]|nr:hypothetical protein [Methanomicrobium sp.]